MTAEEREGRRRARDMAWRLPILSPFSVCTPLSGGDWPLAITLASSVEGAEVEAPFWICDRGGVGMGGRVCDE